jgi:NIMA-interacting peptidyl-prolyl cis-trans isomerase 4
MAPKSNKGGAKAQGAGATKGKAKDDESSTGGKLKPASSINVRHILTEKHGKKEEALAKLREGVKFDDVAREFSEDKARQGTMRMPCSVGRGLLISIRGLSWLEGSWQSAWGL